MSQAPYVNFNNVGVFCFFVDAWRDNDPTTRDASPGKVDGQQLVLIGQQRQRTFWHGFGQGPVKNWIYKVGNMRQVVYKQGPDNPGVVLMGISLSRMDYHPNALPMETYCKIFIDKNETDADVQKVIKDGGCKTLQEWLAQNNFELVSA